MENLQDEEDFFDLETDLYMQEQWWEDNLVDQEYQDFLKKFKIDESNWDYDDYYDYF